MADTLTLQIVTPEREVLTTDVNEVVIPSKMGSMGVLPGHAPLMAVLETGEIQYRVGNQRRFAAVCGGFAEVLRDGVKVLAQTCEPAEEIDVDRAQRAKARGESEMDEHRGQSQTHYDMGEFTVTKAVNRLTVAQRAGS